MKKTINKFIDFSKITSQTGRKNWKLSVGKKFNFVYDDIVGVLYIEDYNDGNLLVNYKNKKQWISIPQISEYKIGNLIDEKYKFDKKTTENYADEVSLITSGEYSLIGEYKTAKEYTEFIHNECMTKFKVTPTHFNSGQRCPVCTKQRFLKNALKYNANDIKKIIYELVENEYELISEYTGGKNYITLRHNECGNEFNVIATSFIHNNSRCPNPECVHKRYDIFSKSLRRSPKDFEKLFYNLSEDEYILLSEYSSSAEKIKIQHVVCGNNFDMKAGNFLSGQRCPFCKAKRISQKKSTSLNDFLKDLHNIQGEEIVLYDGYVNLSTKCSFKCNKCNFIWETTPANVVYQHTGCPRCKQSHGEKEISNFLIKHNIPFVTQKKYNGLIGVGKKELSYDFYVESIKLLIEFQGKQHFIPVEVFGGDKQLQIQKEHDKRKREYAKSHNIKLLEICYWDFDNIEEILERELCVA